MSKKIRDFLKVCTPEKRILQFNIAEPDDIDILKEFLEQCAVLHCKKVESLSSEDHFEYHFQPLLKKSSLCLFTEDPDVLSALEDRRWSYTKSVCFIEKINTKKSTVLVAFYIFPRKILHPEDELVIYYDKNEFSELDLKNISLPLDAEKQFAVFRILADGSFRIYRTGYYLKIIVLEGTKKHYIVQSREKNKNNRIPALLQIFIGKIRFADIQESRDEQNEILQDEINQYRLAAAEYEEVWRQYEEEERAELDEQAKRIGEIQYSACEPVGGQTWRFYLKHEEDYRVLENEFQKDVIELTIAKEQKHSWHGTLEQMFDTMDFAVDVNSYQTEEKSPPSSGSLCLDTYAESVRTKRRKSARDILNGSAVEKHHVVQGLRQVLTDKEWKTNISKTQRTIPAKILDMFPAGLNESQKKALLMAYNTPDFVVIQGPPGTGKTQVISALCQWFGDDLSNTNMTLLSSFQHEAVDNLALRCRIFDIPVQRLTLNASQQTTDVFSVWCDELTERLHRKEELYSKNPVFEVRKEVEVWFGYLEKSSPSLEKSKYILKQILELIRGHVPDTVYEEGAFLLQKWQNVGYISDYPKQFFTLLYGLKCCREAYEDGGADSLAQFLKFVKIMGEKNPIPFQSIEYLESILQKGTHIDDQDLVNLEAIRDMLLDKCLNCDVLAKKEHVHSGLLDDFISHVRQEFESRCTNSVNQVDNIFFQYARTLENDALSFKYACQKYANAVVATTGQSSGQRMRDFTNGKIFDNVIIDEAARANPMDLLIPLTQASRKIILVGDNKQLPHLIEEDKMRKVISKLESSGNEDQVRSALKTTLFERFQTAVQRQYMADGYARFIMLDTQYRMRPALGNMLSEAFYEGKLKNGREDSSFPEIVPYGKRSAVWRDIVIQKGTEERDPITKSLFRCCEAEAAAREAKTVLDSNMEISVGIITFYSAQVRELNSALKKSGIFADEKGTVLSEEYEGRTVKVGTVDAFQGKEFDVVILSTVRASSKALPDEITYDMCRKRFGHLLYPGRVCVALSRQKSLLIVVGALSMFSCDIPDSGLIGFKKLADLCRSGHGEIIQ